MKGYGQKRYLQKIVASLRGDEPCTTNVVLNGFRIGDAQMSLLAMALVRNTRLRTLRLDGNHVTDAGAVLLAYSLRRGAAPLECVSLNDNRIGSDGASALAGVLHDHEHLRTLRLANNAIGDRGAKGLRTMMKRNKRIREVFLEGNNISPEMAGKFDDRCRIERATECDDTAASTASRSDTPDADPAVEKAGRGRGEREETTGEGEAYHAGGTGDDATQAEWEDLAAYMRTVQDRINRRESDGAETSCSDDEDILSVASSEPDGVSAPGGKQKTRWSIFHKTKRDVPAARPASHPPAETDGGRRGEQEERTEGWTASEAEGTGDGGTQAGWEDLAAYMRVLQSGIDQRDVTGAETVCSEDEDILSVDASEPKNSCVAEEEKRKQTKPWSIFKKANRIHSIKRHL